MDEMQAIEQRIAGEMVRRAGPSEPVDDLAVFDAVTAATRSHRRGFMMFSALKLVAAAAIVALFGGFLFTGILTAPQDDDTAPAAATESPSPMSTEALLAGMVTEEVEPGVLRVINDGVRDLSSTDIGFPSHWVDITPDGDVWLSGGSLTFRLGDEATFQGPDDIWWPYPDVGPDGSLWAIADSDYIRSFDGRTWTERTGPTGDDLLLGSLAIGPDGTVWVAASDRDKYCPDTEDADCIGTVLMRLEDDGSLTTIDDWADVYEGDVAYDELAVSPDGDVWLIGMVRWDGPEAKALLRFDGNEWEVIPGPEGFLNVPWGNSLDIGPDGTLWVNTNDPEDGWPEDGDWRVGGLARFDDPGWTAFTEADGVQDWGGQGFIATDLLAVAPDGSLWMNGARDYFGCAGVAHYDGVMWDSYLAESCVHDLAIAPDGSVWVRANTYGMDGNPLGGVDTYVITPEAVAATEAEATPPPSVEQPTITEEATTTTEELLSGMVTEEVEPGVLRVVNDGVRDLGALRGSWGNDGGVTIGADGTVWVHTAYGRYFRVGSSPTRDLPKEFLDVEDANAQSFGADALYAGPSGQLWAKDAKSGRVNVWMHDEWLERADLVIDSMAVDGSNEVWAASQWGLLHVDADGETLIAWPDDLIQKVVPYTLDVSADGSADVLSGPVRPDPESGFLDTLLRYDGNGWTEIRLPASISVWFPGDGMTVGADGTVWVAGDDHGDTDYMHHSLARLDGSEWTVFTADDGVRPWGGKEGFVPDEMLSISTDGSVWVDASTLDEGSWWAECDGLARFDGATWSQYLSGRCLFDIDFAPDGSAWALVDGDDSPVEVYVITPEAVAASVDETVAQADEDRRTSVGDGGSPEAGSPAGIDPPGTTTFTEIEGVPYLTVGEDVFEADIHVPDVDGPSPVVVMFHGASPRGKDDSHTTVVAEAAAAAGMHVFVPNWLTAITPDSFDVFHAAANCAVAYAQAELADGAPVVVYGFSAGVGPASEAVLDPAREPVPGCVADDAPAPIAGAVFGDGEYFLHSRLFDSSFAADLEAMQAVVAGAVDATLWPSDMSTRFFLWVADGGTAPRAFDDPWDETGWLAQRDPDGSIRDDLDRLGQLDDGVVSFVDEGQLMELRLREAGIEVSLDDFPGGHTTGDKLSELISYLQEAAAVD